MEFENIRKVLIIEDDEDHYLLFRKAFIEAAAPTTLSRMSDGEEFWQLINRLGEDRPYETQKMMPDLIILDLNLPKMDGRELLDKIKKHPQVRKTPVIIWSTSNEPEDVETSYAKGANSYVCKPQSYKKYVEAVRQLAVYWFDICTLAS